MSDPDTDSRDTLPIERGFPIEQVNDLADREGRAKIHYRPLSTMHKWLARRLGSVFRAISLYSLVDDPSDIELDSTDKGSQSLSDFSDDDADITEDQALAQLIESVSLTEPDALWELYSRDVRVNGKTHPRSIHGWWNEPHGDYPSWGSRNWC
jgi:Protein of unknown function (DUF1156).